MGRGWRNQTVKVRLRAKDVPEDVEKVYKIIRAYTEECMATEYAREIFNWRVRRGGFPKRIHYSRRVKELNRLMHRVLKYKTSPEYAMLRLERMQNT